ncbi:MAG: response regulator [Deltaproteobacteria bacterium]|nr:response regulator [Deltaproteobacteria bacterium]
MTGKKSRITQVMERFSLGIPAPTGDGVERVVRMIENGDEARRIYSAIAECAANTPGVAGAALYLPSDRLNNEQEIIASVGDFNAESDESRARITSSLSLQSASSQMHKSVSGDYNYFDIICLGAAMGTLAVIAPKSLSNEASQKLTQLAFYGGIVFERTRLSSTLQHFLDRVQILNELNQLIASNVGLQRIVKSLAKESAFRFAADLSITFLLDEERKALETKGGYGCAPNLIPKAIPLGPGILGQVMQLGGHLSMSNLSNHSNHGLAFLEDLGIRAIDVCSLEVRGEPLGAILIGFKRDHTISKDDLTKFEEFCQGAAVAILNARTQEQVAAYTEKLEDLVNQRTADLAVQTARAEEANQAKSQFLANMSHELRTPLTAIVGYSSVLSDGIFGPLNDKQLDALNAVTRSSEHLKNLIDDVLNLARIESGKEEPEPTKVPLKDLLAQAHKLMLQTAIGKSISLEPVKLADEVAKAHLYCDHKHIHQIIINLMSNAVKYTPKGGKVWINAELLVDKAKISISDSGVGVPPHKLAKLFERFERGEDAYSKSQEGTGIGLNLTQRLVELNGGKIGVESRVGQGSTFWIMMPLASNDSVSITQSDTAELRFRLDGLTTLVVDDNFDTCEVLKHILASAGASVKVAHSVKEGIKELGEALPDLVLTDLAMPGENGLSLIKHIRGNSEDVRRIPIIVLSACAFDSDKQAALQAGASLFMPKPFKPNEIVKNVRQLTLNNAMQG